MDDHKNVPPMEQRRLVTYINDFIMSTVTFLNDFMAHCEIKMMKAEQRLQNISASLCILETKLNSVPELRELKPQTIVPSEPPNNQSGDSLHSTETIDEPNCAKDDIIPDPVKPEFVNDGSEEPIVDPTIIKYRKMLQFGVPRGAVELKMVNEGLDPKLLC